MLGFIDWEQIAVFLELVPPAFGVILGSVIAIFIFRILASFL